MKNMYFVRNRKSLLANAYLDKTSIDYDDSKHYKSFDMRIKSASKKRSYISMSNDSQL